MVITSNFVEINKSCSIYLILRIYTIWIYIYIIPFTIDSLKNTFFLFFIFLHLLANQPFEGPCTPVWKLQAKV